MSPTRGLMEYDNIKDLFTEIKKDVKRIAGLELFPEPEIHTVFGDSYLVLSFMKKNDIIGLLTLLELKEF